MTPLNRMLLIEPVTQDEKKKEGEPSFLLPQDVVVNKKDYELVKVLQVAGDSKFKDGLVKSGDLVLVEAHMIKKIVHEGAKHHLVLENYLVSKL